MDLKGYESVRRVLNHEDINATISPQPEGSQGVAFVSIKTGPTTPPADVLNALNWAGYVHHEQPSDPGMVLRPGPKLKILGVQLGNLTFEDTKTTRRQ